MKETERKKARHAPKKNKYGRRSSAAEVGEPAGRHDDAATFEKKSGEAEIKRLNAPLTSKKKSFRPRDAKKKLWGHQIPKRENGER